jgi:hypothetical protein
MQAKKQRFRPASYKTAEGLPNGIVSKLELIAKFTRIQIKEKETDDGKIKAIADSYRNILKWIESQPDGTREKFKSTKNRIRFQAEAQIVKDGTIFPEYYQLFGIDKKTLTRKIVFRKKLIEFIVKVLTEPFMLPYMRADATKGKLTDYSKATALIQEFEKLIYEENPRRVPLTREQEEDLLKGEKLNDEPEYKPEPLTDQERNRQLLELTDQIGDEINLKNKEKRKPENLCYFLLYDVKPEILPAYYERIKVEGYSEVRPEEVKLILIENPEKLRERISDLSRSNLIQLIRIYCEAHNNFYSKEINEQRTANKMETTKNRQIKKVSATEKRDLIQMGKSDGMKQTEVAKSLGCSIETVKRGWK